MEFLHHAGFVLAVVFVALPAHAFQSGRWTPRCPIANVIATCKAPLGVQYVYADGRADGAPVICGER